MANPIPTPNAFTPEMQAQFNDLMALSTGRAARQEPIHQAAMAMATRMAPSYARGAMSPVRAASTPGAGGAGSGAGTDAAGGDSKKMMAAFLAALLGAAGSGGGGELGGLLGLLKKLFNRNGLNYPVSENTTGQPFIGPKHTTYQGGTPGNPQDLDPFSIPGYQPSVDPMPNVDTSMDFGGVAGGFPNYPEDPNSAASNWWDLMPGGGSVGDTPGGNVGWKP